MTKAGTLDDMAALAGADGAFHRTIVQASRNSLLIEVYDYLGTARDRPHRVVSPGLLTGVGALVPTIQHDKGASEAWSGVLTAAAGDARVAALRHREAAGRGAQRADGRRRYEAGRDRLVRR